MVIALYIVVIISLNFCPICGEESEEKEGRLQESTAIENEQFLEEVLPDLYRNYREALERANETSYRRILRNNRLFQMHVDKLKEVNGLKNHNLVIKLSTQDKPLIYINNPVESKVPHPYLSIEELKKLLTDRVLKQKKEFVKKHIKPKIVEKKYTPRVANNKYITKVNRKRKFSTVKSTDKIQTKPTENKRIMNKISTHTMTTVTSIPNSTTTGFYLAKTNHIVKKKADIDKTTRGTSTTQATDKLTFNEVKKTKTLQDTIINNSTESVTYRTTVTKVTEINNTNFKVEQQNISKLNETEPLVREKLKESKENVTGNGVNAVIAQVVDIKRSDSEENNKNITQLVEDNTQEDKIVNQTSTPKNLTTNILETTTTQNKDFLNMDLEGKEQKTTNSEKTEPSQRKELTKLKENVTESGVNAVTSQVIEGKRSDSEENTKNTTELVKQKTQVVINVEQTSNPGNETSNISETTTTELKKILTRDSEANEQKTINSEKINSSKQINEENTEPSTKNDISEDVSQETEANTTEYKEFLTTDSEKNAQNTTTSEKMDYFKQRNEKNTEASTTKDTSEDETQESEEDSSDSEEVTEKTTTSSTTVLTKWTRLSRPLVFMANDQTPAPDNNV